ncbi:outer membrane protein [Spirosomataceae bacterium TFI 002]|nr:outer membrane protein [Spirosomataceae bacterium TFI 002]
MRIFLFLLFLLFSFITKAQKGMSLEDCINYAYEHSPIVKQSTINLEKSDNSLERSKKAFFPTISTGFSQGLNSGRSIDPFTNDFVQRTIASNSYSVGSNLAIFNGFANKYQIELNEQNFATSKLEIERVKFDLGNNVTIAYMNVLMAQELEQFNTENKELLKVELARVLALVKEGQLPKTDIIDMNARMASLDYEITSAQQAIKNSKLSLARLMYFNDFEQLSIKSIPLNRDSFKTQPENKLIAIQKLPAYKIAFQGLQNANIAMKLAQTEKLPSVSLNVGLGTGYSSVAANETPYFNQIGRNFNQSGRLSINFPIFTNGQIKYKTQEAKLDKLIAESQINQTRFELTQEVQEAILLVEAAQAKYKSAIIQLEAQNASLNAAKERFFEGLINSIELNTVQQAVNKANSDLIISKYEYYFRGLVLERY